MERQTKRPTVDSIDVFISHAGPDKFFIARPLSNKLQALGLTCFLDRTSMEPGDHGPNEMTQAMKSAKMGVFILSPDFAARKWTMRELRCFLRRRREAASTGTPPPILIPVFYRLSIRECRELQLDQYQDDEGRNIFEVEKFYSEERQREATTEEVRSELRELADLTGIENREDATNLLDDEFAHDAREVLVERISMWVKRKCEEQGHPRVRGESIPSARGTTRITGVVCDARGQQRNSRSLRNESEREEFTPSFDVPENPPHVILKFRQRPEIGTETASDPSPEEQLRKKLLGPDAPQSVGAVGAGSRTTVGMKGMGGIGKSCALRGLAVDGEVRKKFCDGIYWLVLGQDATKRGVVEQLARITRESGGRLEAKEVREESEVDSAISRVKKWFKGRKILLLIDDVWRNAEVGSCAVTRLQEIADAEKGSCMAFTAREWSLVAGSEEIEFSLKEDASSLEILLRSAAIRKEDIAGLENEMERILRFCGGLPLALSVVGKAIKTHREFANELGLRGVLGEYLKILEDSPSEVLDEEVDGYVYRNLRSSFAVSLSMMDRNKARGDVYPMSYTKMYESLIVIQRQGWLPLNALCALWGLTRQVKATKVLREFVKASLAERKDKVGSDGQPTVGIRLHDLQLDYIQQRCGSEGEKKWHDKLVQEWEWKECESMQGMAWVCGRKWKSNVAEDEYFRDNLCRHLKGAGLKDELCKVLSDPRWAAGRLTRGEGMGLQEDFKIFMSMGGETERGCEAGGTVWSLGKVAREARLSASYVVRHPREVWFQLYDRLLRFRDKSELIREYLCTIERVAERPWLKSLTPRTDASDVVQDIFVDQGNIEGMSGCAEKNEVTAWGRDGEHLFRRTFRNGEVKRSVTCEVPEDMASVWSRDGKYVAEKRVGIDVQVWDMHTGGTAQRVGREFNLGNFGNYSWRWKWDLTRDGKRLALGKEGGWVMLWDVETGTKIKEVRSGRNKEFHEVLFSPDGKRLMSAGERRSYLMLDGETGETISEYNLPKMDEDVYYRDCRAWWSRNGRWTACQSKDYRVRGARCFLIFDGKTGQKIWHEETLPGASVNCCSWSEDEKRLWFLRDDELCVWDESSRKIITKGKLSGSQHVREMSLTGDERWIAVCGRGGWVAMLDAQKGAHIWSDNEQHSIEVNIVGWLQDGKRLFSADESGKIVIWGWDNLESERDEKRCKEKRKRSVTAVLWSSGDTCTTAVGEDGEVLMYDVKTGKVVWRDVETHTSAVHCLKISGDNKRVFSVAVDGKVATWNMATGEKLWEARIDVKFEEDKTTAWCSNDGAKMLAWNRAGMTLLDVETGDKLWEKSADRRISCGAWCGDDTKIAFGDLSGKVVVRSSKTGELVEHHAAVLVHHARDVNLVKWSPDDKWIASSGFGWTWDFKWGVAIWNWETGAKFWSPEETQVSVVPNMSCLEWSDDGRRVAYGGYDKLVIWNLQTGRRIAQRFGMSLNHIAWSHDGSRVATLSGGNDNFILRISNVMTQAFSWTEKGPLALSQLSLIQHSFHQHLSQHGLNQQLSQHGLNHHGLIQYSLTQHLSQAQRACLNTPYQAVVGVKRYDDVACFDQSGLRQLINTEGGQLSAELERNLQIRRKGDGLFYTAGDEEIRLATVVHVSDGGWYWSTSCRHFAISRLLEDDKPYFYELVE